MLQRIWLIMALSGHPTVARQCLLLGE